MLVNILDHNLILTLSSFGDKYKVIRAYWWNNTKQEGVWCLIHPVGYASYILIPQLEKTTVS